jgi:anaerobic ribonucleoside-triphosphate reductase activating protein
MSLNFSYHQVVLTEVPGEISLALSISGCPLACKGCHSTFSRNPNYGELLTTEQIDKHLNPHVSAVLFYGGEWEPNILLELLNYCQSKGLKTCLYTGYELEFIPNQLLTSLDFIKVGPYKAELGGLESPTTNQRFYQLTNGTIDSELLFY